MVWLWNVGLGCVCIFLGATGKAALIGTESTGALAAVGAVFVIMGLVQLKNKDRGYLAARSISKIPRSGISLSFGVRANQLRWSSEKDSDW